jgi:hypothetical protein
VYLRLLLAVRDQVAVASARALFCQKGAGKQWRDFRVSYILTNPVYAGANVCGRHRHSDTRVKERSEWTLVPGMRQSLVAPDAFDRARRMMTAEAEVASGKRQPSWFSGR